MGLLGGFKGKLIGKSKKKEKTSKNQVVCIKFNTFSEFDQDNTIPSCSNENLGRNDVIRERRRPSKPEIASVFEKQKQPETKKQVQPETTKPVQPETRKPVQPETRKPVQPETRKPVQPETKKPVQPETRKPVQPETKKQVQHETKKQVQPETKKPVQAKTKKQVQHETKKQVQPETKKQVQPEASKKQVKPEVTPPSKQANGDVHKEKVGAKAPRGGKGKAKAPKVPTPVPEPPAPETVTRNLEVTPVPILTETLKFPLQVSDDDDDDGGNFKIHFSGNANYNFGDLSDDESYIDNATDLSPVHYSSQATSIFFGGEEEPVVIRPRKVIVNDEDLSDGSSASA